MDSPPPTTAGHPARVVADGFPRTGGVMSHTQDETETIEDRGRRWHHLRPRPRRRTDLVGFKSTLWMALGWLIVILLLVFPFPWAW
jgi:hypothetical protein